MAERTDDYESYDQQTNDGKHEQGHAADQA